MFDEPLKAALGGYKDAHTKAWSNRISSFAGFVFVFPQYNWGYPAALKNAFDYWSAARSGDSSGYGAWWAGGVRIVSYSMEVRQPKAS